MNKFSKHLRGQGESVTSGKECGYLRPRRSMTGVLNNFSGDQVSSVDSVIQCRPSSISSNKSSSGLNGRIIWPRLTGAMSRTLCGEVVLGRRSRIRSESHSNKLSCWSGGRASAARSISVNVDMHFLYAK
jgi:hypothetical protein